MLCYRREHLNLLSNILLWECNVIIGCIREHYRFSMHTVLCYAADKVIYSIAYLGSFERILVFTENYFSQHPGNVYSV